MTAAVRALVVLVTAGSAEVAATLGRHLIEERLAGCVNVVGPIRSIYRWKDRVEDESEWLLVIKSRSALYSVLETRIKQLHPYEVPEVLALRPVAGSAQYLDWLMDAAPRRSRKGSKCR